MDSDPRSGGAGRGRGERFFDQLFERSPVAMQIFAPDGTLVRTNEAFCELVGLPSCEAGVGVYNVLRDPFALRIGSTERFTRALAGETVLRRNQTVDLAPSSRRLMTSPKLVHFDSVFFRSMTIQGDWRPWFSCCGTPATVSGPRWPRASSSPSSATSCVPL
ncbi:MAG TPA: PAS domain S-box protein [Thermoanaerobaculia bacterium]|nr:PAS domain S-box protein [Thermoanaerobaculia bacterium]